MNNGSGGQAQDAAQFFARDGDQRFVGFVEDRFVAGAAEEAAQHDAIVGGADMGTWCRRRCRRPGGRAPLRDQKAEAGALAVEFAGFVDQARESARSCSRCRRAVRDELGDRGPDSRGAADQAGPARITLVRVDPIAAGADAESAASPFDRFHFRVSHIGVGRRERFDHGRRGRS